MVLNNRRCLFDRDSSCPVAFRSSSPETFLPEPPRIYVEATIEALLSIIAYFRILLARAKEILGEIERAVSGWRDRGKALGMTDRELETFADAFEHPERKAARQAMS